jgi:hypothetical protein
MPLHTSDNHDGQLTDQRIHSLWESRLPELFVRITNLPWPQRYYEDVNKATWDLIMDTQFSGAALSCR